MDTNTLKKILPNCRNPEGWSNELQTVLPTFSICTKEEVASFMAQAGHESSSFNVVQENLNYSQDGLRKVFSKYFPDDNTAFKYARQPQAIASRVYADRMGNGGEKTGDGWKYRGRGLIQLTGKNNYSRCSLALFQDDRLLETPDLLAQPHWALVSACWFWQANNLNKYASDVKATTKIVNGGYHGLADRSMIYQKALAYLQHENLCTS